MQMRTSSLHRRSGAAAAGVTCLLVASLAGPTSNAYASVETGPTRLWAAAYHAPYNIADAVSSTLSPDGSRLFVLGTMYTPQTDDDLVTVAYDTRAGTRLWSARFNGLANVTDVASAIAVSPDGSRIYVTGSTVAAIGAGTDIVTIAYEASTGARVWAKRYDGPSNAGDYGTAIAVRPNGSAVYVVGTSCTSTDCDFFAIAYRSGGAKLWTYRAIGSGDADAVAVSPDGASVYVTGTGGAAGAIDCVTTSLVATTGAVRWASAYDDPAGWADGCRRLAVAAGGADVYAVGYTFLADGLEWVVLDLDPATGMIAWASRRDGAWPNAITVTPDGGRVFVAGAAGMDCGGQGCGPFLTAAYDAAEGSEVWSTAAPSDGHAVALGLGPTGDELYVTGPQLEDFATIALDPDTGSQRWNVRYGTLSVADEPVSISVSPDGGRIYVAGTGRKAPGSEGSTNIDWVETVAYGVS